MAAQKSASKEKAEIHEQISRDGSHCSYLMFSGFQDFTKDGPGWKPIELVSPGKATQLSQEEKSMIGSYRVLLLLGSLSLFWAAGCTSPMTSTGWNFTVGKPATMIAPAAIAQGPSTLAMYPVAAMPSSAPRGASLAATGPDCGPCPPAVGAGGGTGGTLAALGLACDLNSICTRLDRIERRLGNPAVGLPPPRPLPPGSSSELHP